MNRWSKGWLVAEIIVCFTPVTLALLLGVALPLPMQFVGVVQEPLEWRGAAIVAGLDFAGIVGLCTVVFLASSLKGCAS